MTSIHFFQVKGKDIANRCSVSINGLTITINSIWTGNTATYQARSSYEVMVIRSILERNGSVVAEIVE